MQVIKINRNKRLYTEPHVGHNRWHPDLTPVVSVDPGEIVRVETRDAADGQIKLGMTVDDVASLSPKVSTPADRADIRQRSRAR